MKNNKGFSILELVISFGLTMIIVVILFELVIIMKSLYEKSVTETELMNKQNLFTDYIYSDLNSIDNPLLSVDSCISDNENVGNNCISFQYQNGTKNLEWSYEGTSTEQLFPTLKYGDYKINLINGSRFGYLVEGSDTVSPKICSGYSYFSIHLPIYNKVFKDKDFGINIVYYNNNSGAEFNLIPNC